MAVEALNRQFTNTQISPKEKSKQEIINAVLETMQRINSAANKNLANYKKDIRCLNSGIYYPQEYFSCLQEKNRTQHVEYYRNKGMFYHGMAPKEFFEPISSKKETHPTGFVPFAFQLKEGKKPSEALDALESQLSLLDCGNVCQLSYWRGIEYALGKEKFDHLFSSTATTLILGDVANNPINLLTKQTPIKSESELSEGQTVFFSNHRLHPVKHINDHFCGWNVLVDKDSSEKKFIGFGCTTSLSSLEIKTLMWHKFNESPKYQETLSQELYTLCVERSAEPIKKAIKSGRFTSVQLPFDEFSKEQAEGGKLRMSAGSLHFSRIETLAKLDIKEAKKQFEKWTLHPHLEDEKKS